MPVEFKRGHWVPEVELQRVVRPACGSWEVTLHPLWEQWGLWASLSLRLTFLHVCVWLHVGMGTEMKVWVRVCSRAGSPWTDWSQAVVGHLAWTLGWVCTLPKSSFLNAEPDFQPLGPFILQVLKSHLITFFIIPVRGLQTKITHTLPSRRKS